MLYVTDDFKIRKWYILNIFVNENNYASNSLVWGLMDSNSCEREIERERENL